MAKIVYKNEKLNLLIKQSYLNGDIENWKNNVVRDIIHFSVHFNEDFDAGLRYIIDESEMAYEMYDELNSLDMEYENERERQEIAYNDDCGYDN